MTQSQTGRGDMARSPVCSLGLTLPELLISLSVMSIMAFAALNFLPPLIHSKPDVRRGQPVCGGAAAGTQ